MQATDNDVDTLYARPEVADCFCPVRVKTRLAKLLAEDSPLVYRSPEATIWLGHGGFILFYAAESVAALERELPRALEQLAPLGREAGVGSLMGKLSGRGLFVSGTLARWMYMSLHLMHHRAVLGFWRTAALALARLLMRRTQPRVKLH